MWKNREEKSYTKVIFDLAKSYFALPTGMALRNQSPGANIQIESTFKTCLTPSKQSIPCHCFGVRDDASSIYLLDFSSPVGASKVSMTTYSPAGWPQKNMIPRAASMTQISRLLKQQVPIARDNEKKSGLSGGTVAFRSIIQSKG